MEKCGEDTLLPALGGGHPEKSSVQSSVSTPDATGKCARSTMALLLCSKSGGKSPSGKRPAADQKMGGCGPEDHGRNTGIVNTDLI